MGEPDTPKIIDASGWLKGIKSIIEVTSESGNNQDDILPEYLPLKGCRVFWGSHGCRHPYHHDKSIPHECDCCECPNHPHHPEECEWVCVAKPPYYGSDTRFYGEDVEYYGLPYLSENSK